jgi:hypothetical protein
MQTLPREPMIRLPRLNFVQSRKIRRVAPPPADSNQMPISIPNYDPKNDRLRFGMLIGIASES